MAAEEKSEKTTKESGADHGGGFGPTMGMEIMKKMMAQMGQAGGAVSMMQKMMAQIGQAKQGGEAAPPMQNMMAMCMSMCAEMLATMQQTTAMATFATPELRGLFSEWLTALEEEALAALKGKGELEPAQLAQALKISADGALYLLIQMARQNKVSIWAQASQTP